MTPEAIRRVFFERDHYARALEIELLEINPDHGVAVMPLDDRHKNGMGTAHGGAIFSLADMAFAAASNASGIYWVSAQSSISYLEPGRVSPLRAEALCVRRGQHLGVYEVRITDGAGTLVAVASVTGYNTGVPMPHYA